MSLEIIRPRTEHLESLKAALRRGYSPDSQRDVSAELLAKIETDPERFLALQDDRQARGGPITMPDGSSVPRLPGFHLWAWDGEFCGTVGARWSPGSTDLPPTCPGHIGYSVVAWRRGQGIATRLLAAVLPEMRALGLPFVILTTQPDNVASQKVILANGGVSLGCFTKPEALGGGTSLKFRIDL